MTTPYRTNVKLCAVCEKPLFGGSGHSLHHYKDGKRIDFADVQLGRVHGAKAVWNEPVCGHACEAEWFRRYEKTHGIVLTPAQEEHARKIAEFLLGGRKFQTAEDLEKERVAILKRRF